MLETIDLSPSLSKHAYKHIMHYQVERLYELEHMAYTTKVPVIILFEGWDAAGKGTAISRHTERLDPRGYKVLPTQAPRTHEMQKPVPAGKGPPTKTKQIFRCVCVYMCIYIYIYILYTYICTYAICSNRHVCVYVPVHVTYTPAYNGYICL